MRKSTEFQRFSTYARSTLLSWLINLVLIGLSRPFAEAQTEIRGKVLSEDDNQPIPYALITDPQHRFGAYADGEGAFIARIPAGIDTLLITCVGFHERLFILKTPGENPDFRLRPKPTVLSEVVVRGRRPRIVVVGALRKRAPIIWGNCSGRNIEFALHIRNSRGIPGALQKVGYLIARGGIPTAPFRVRVYECVDGAPGNDLLPHSVVTNARRGNSWCEVDLSRFRILFPKEGLFVAMEWLSTDEARYRFSSAYRKADGRKNSQECFGQYLAFSKEIRPATYWERINGGTWRRHAPLSRVGVGEHPVIQAKIALAR